MCLGMWYNNGDVQAAAGDEAAPPGTEENPMDIRAKLNDEREQVLRLAAQHGARKVRVFGSVARGDATSQSDVDLLVELGPEVSLLDHIALEQDLQDLLGTSVDVVNEKALHRSIRHRVLAEARPL